MVQQTECCLPSCGGRCSAADSHSNLWNSFMRSPETAPMRFYLCPEGKSSFDGSLITRDAALVCHIAIRVLWNKRTAAAIRCISTRRHEIFLTTHDATWSHRDSLCDGQYEVPAQPEAFPTARRYGRRSSNFQSTPATSPLPSLALTRSRYARDYFLKK